jgi:hypothetical protein
VGVQRFRTFEEARRALWLRPGDPRILERMKRLGELARAPGRPPGVSRFRTIEEAKADRPPSRRR